MRRSPEIRNTLALSAIMLMMRALLAGTTPVYADTNPLRVDPDQDDHRIVIDAGAWNEARHNNLALPSDQPETEAPPQPAVAGSDPPSVVVVERNPEPFSGSPDIPLHSPSSFTPSNEIPPPAPDVDGPTRQERDPLEGITLVPIETHYFYAEGQYVTIQLQLGMHENLQTEQPLTHVAQWGVPSSKWHFGSNGTFLEVTITNDDGAEETFNDTEATGNAAIEETLNFSDTPENPLPASVMAITDGTRVTGISSEVNGQPLELTGHVFWGEDAATGAEWVALQNMSGHWEMPFNQPGYTLEVGIGTLVEEEGQEPRLELPTEWAAAVNGVVPIEVPQPQGYMVFRITPIATAATQ